MSASAGDLKLYSATANVAFAVNPNLSGCNPPPAPGSYVVGHVGVVSTTNPGWNGSGVGVSITPPTLAKPTYLLNKIMAKLADLEKRIDVLNAKLEAKEKAELLAAIENIAKELKK